MGWEDYLRPAAFRGYEFEAVELDEKGGVRLSVDEIPESDDHAVGELGAKIEPLSIRGFVRGDDYLEQIGNLKAAFRKRGAGELVHPWRGRLLVYVQDWTFAHDLGGGVGEFTLEIIPAGVETRPTVTVVTETDVVDKGDAAIGVVNDERDAAWDTIATLSDALSTAALVAASDELADVALIFGVTEDDLEGLARGTKAADFFGAVDSLTTLLRYLTRPGTNVPASVGTPSGDTMAEAAQTLITSIRLPALARACALATEQSLPSSDAASELSAILVRVIDAELALEPPDEVFSALSDLRASFVAAMLDAVARLPKLRTLEVRAPTPAMLLAFDLYGDVEREGEILDVNGGGHPGFLSGTLSVVSR